MMYLSLLQSILAHPGTNVNWQLVVAVVMLLMMLIDVVLRHRRR